MNKLYMSINELWVNKLIFPWINSDVNLKAGHMFWPQYKGLGNLWLVKLFPNSHLIKQNLIWHSTSINLHVRVFHQLWKADRIVLKITWKQPQDSKVKQN